MQFFKLLFSSTLLLSTIYAQNECKSLGINVEDCGEKLDAVQLSEFLITPTEIHRGEEIKVHARGKLTETIQPGAMFEYYLYRNGLHMHSDKIDICETLAEKKAKIQCPIQPQDFDISEVFTIPHQVPRGNYLLSATASDDSMSIFAVKGNLRVL